MQEARGAIIIGIAAIAYGFFCLYRIIRFRNWKTAEGKIVSSRKTSRRENFQTFEDADIKFEYIVKDKTYLSSSVKAAGEISSNSKKGEESEVDKLLAKYPVGEPVVVYYNPRVPRISCLEIGGSEAMVISLICGAAALIVGYFWLD